ncbi:TrlF family AAA-like ATPase [Croceibacterium ferulae]|uniref:TrlF family AAA-like ATPase n=1 Tax=Croceibacterium ferulae TaxID=1854641 RepID=UPI0019D41A89|nr:AAA family ATPase [Croceibacterium ferulae]
MIDNTEIGAIWRRWDPHVHAPGTQLNDLFIGADAWEDYVRKLEEVTPALEVIGVTDYYNTETYARLRQEKDKNGRLPNCSTLFPNIEMRLGLGTAAGSWVNVHLLVSPEDPKHLDELNRILSSLTFNALDDRFSCTSTELARLGFKADPTIKDDGAARRHGSTQFKVSFDQLKSIFNDFRWARDNILVAVAAGADGTSGMQDGADATLRREVEKFASAIFSANPKDRDFWLGRKLPREEFLRKYASGKPCLHGSDAHSLDRVGEPNGKRFSWIKGAPSFDSLRQAYISPERAFVGEIPPSGASKSQVISHFSIEGATWARTPSLRLNPGLVTIIGARGSGKTALAELIIAGCDAVPLPLEEHKQSFLYRARDLLTGVVVKAVWASGEFDKRLLADATSESFQIRRAQYLSQQFVDRLCSSDGVSDELLREVERVVFDSHSVAARDGATDFHELLDLRAARHREARSRDELALVNLSERIGEEIEKTKSIGGLQKQITEKEQNLARLTNERGLLVKKSDATTAARLTEVSTAAEKVRGDVRHFSIQEQQLLTLQDEVADFRNNQSPEALRRLQSKFGSSGLAGSDWDPFGTDFVGTVGDVLAGRLKKARDSGAAWKGVPLAPGVAPVPLAQAVELEQQTLAVLDAEITRLNHIINIDKATQDKFTQLTTKINTETDTLSNLKTRLEDANGAADRREMLVAERTKSYKSVFDSLIAEERVLNDLYSPIEKRLGASQGTLNKLAFSVRRTADIDQWARAGEAFVDLRKSGPFKGKGTLYELAQEHLREAWEQGSAQDVSDAMQQFRATHDKILLASSRVAETDPVAHRAWLKAFARWLYSTDHISVRYSVDYDSTDIRNLSPGTRGIVLLLLYLALDRSDDRPLIIDQPEENLDPKSIFDELVPLFAEAKLHRQVIMVTHNANLVINTDADQVIIAEAGTHVPGQLPAISYIAGGLEEAHIRARVCAILEGGEDAFKARARRLRVSI